MKLTHWGIYNKGWAFFFKEEQTVLKTLLLIVTSLLLLLGQLHLQNLLLMMVVLIIIRKTCAGGICCNDVKLTGQVIIITGSNTGIGKETARDLASRGAEVILACRDMKKAEKVAAELIAETGSKIAAYKLDLSSFASIKTFAQSISQDYKRIHCLINNAGIMMCPYMETENGLEMQMGVNHFGHFLLTKLLLPLLSQGHPARIINVSSDAHTRGGTIPFDDFNYKNGYNSFFAYSNSKLANILHMRHMSKELAGTNIQLFALHPGVVESELGRHLPLKLGFFYSKIFSFLFKSTKEGAQTTIFCATEAVQHPYFYFADCIPRCPTANARNDEMAERLWKVSEKMVRL